MAAPRPPSRQAATLNRRTLFAAAAATAALPAGEASAGPASPLPPSQPRSPAEAIRGYLGGYERLPSLDLESRLDFLWGLERFDFRKASGPRVDAILANAGIGATDPVDTARAVALLAPDPVVAAERKAYLTSQQMKMRVVGDHFDANADAYLDEMDAAQAKGPGRLELNPALDIPEYSRHELHMQPGGYVGSPFAGYVFRYAIVGLASGHNFQNETHDKIAAATPVPVDGRVRRILDLGCGIGQLSSALKGRFPGAEVWGLDTSGPMLRYAHVRATDLKIDVRYVQRLAEAPGFEDGAFDLITASGLFHEIAAEGARAIVAQVGRLLRPGGVFYPLDLYTGQPPGDDARSRFAVWFSHRWYHEDFRMQYEAIDLPAEMRKAGMIANEQGPSFYPPPAFNLMGVKQA